MSKQKQSTQQTGNNAPIQGRSIQSITNNGKFDGTEQSKPKRSKDGGHQGLANKNYESVRGADVESELNVLSQSRIKKGTNPNSNLPVRQSNVPMVTDGQGTGQVSHLLSIGDEGENRQPLNTNISATRQEIFMIEDGENKSSKDKNIISDGR